MGVLLDNLFVTREERDFCIKAFYTDHNFAKVYTDHNFAKEEISPKYSNLSCDSHKEVFDKLFDKESNINIINDTN